MRIISKFKDYYDSAQGLGIDKTLVYVRHPSKVKISESDIKTIDDMVKDAPRYRRNNYDPDLISSYNIIIGFCGNIYPCIELRRSVKQKNSYGVVESEDESTYIYSYDELICYLIRHKLNKELDSLTNKSIFYGNNKVSAQKFFNLGENSSRLEHLFINNKTPIFVIVNEKEIQVGRDVTTHKGCSSGISSVPITEKNGVIINPNLKDLDFCRIVNSFTAFQEISMYIGGVIPKDGPEMVEISDKMMLQKKGYNEESFRKMPDNRRRKRKSGKIKKKR